MKETTEKEVNGKATQPSTEQIRKNIQQDLEAAHYLLGLVLSTPNIKQAVLDHMTEQIETYTKMTSGTKIDEHA